MKITITDDSYREKVRARVREARDAAIGDGFVFKGKRFDSDPLSLQRIANAATLALIAKSRGVDWNTVWICADNSTMPLGLEDMLDLGVVAGKFADATTADELDAIQWTK
jgi:hypothetical protein